MIRRAGFAPAPPALPVTLRGSSTTRASRPELRRRRLGGARGLRPEGSVGPARRRASGSAARAQDGGAGAWAGTPPERLSGRPIQSEDELGTLRTVIWGNPEADLPLAGVGAFGVPQLNIAADGLLLGRLEAGSFVPMASDPLGTTVLDGIDFPPPVDAFGEQVQTMSANRHVYAGLELLQGTPFQMARHRLYDSGVGRFTSMDPIRLGGGDHRFGYAENQPTGFSDPSGWSAWMGGAMGAMGAQGAGISAPVAATASAKNPNGGDSGSREGGTGRITVCDSLGICKVVWTTTGAASASARAESDPAAGYNRGPIIDDHGIVRDYNPRGSWQDPVPVGSGEGSAQASTRAKKSGPAPVATSDKPTEPTAPPSPDGTGGTGGTGDTGYMGAATTNRVVGTEPANSGFDIRAEVALSTGAGVFMSDVFSPAYARGAETVAGSPLGMLLGGASASQVGMAGGRFYLDGLLSGPMGLIDAGFVTYSGVRAVPQAVAAPYDNIRQIGPIFSGDPNQAAAAWKQAVSNDKAMASVAAAVFAVEGVRIGASRGLPRNAHLAGKTHPVTGIPFDDAGFPNFSSVSKADVKVTYTGNRAGDFKAANEAAGFPDTPEGFTWHHHQDGTTMQLVPRDIHATTGHSGGLSNP